MNFKLWTVASVSLSLAAMAGCVVRPTSGGNLSSGGNETDPTGGAGGTAASSGETTGSGVVMDSPARAFYVSNVHAALVSADAQTHSCTSCHASGLNGAPVFLADEAEKSYDTAAGYAGIISIPASSVLLLHGKHTGPALSPTQANMITAWLDMEAKERGLDGGGTMGNGSSAASGAMPPIVTLDSALKDFANCMSINDWLANGLDKLPNVQTGFNNATCNACHINGEYGNMLVAGNANATFDAQKQFPYIKRWVSGTYDMDGNFVGLKAVPREYLKGKEAELCDKATDTCHPKYINKMPAELMTGIDNFIATTLDKMAKKQCP